MTKYQRGELMEGWNDCPVPMLTSNGASASAGAAKPRRRASRASVVGNHESNNQKWQESRTALTPPSSAGPPPSRPATNNSESDKTAENNTVDIADTEEKLRELVDERSATDKEKEFFTKRLVDQFPTLAEQHQAFVAQIVSGLINKEASSALKQKVLNYMMVSSGVSMWCVPLKKLVEIAA